MIIYNITTKVHESIQNEWLQWMQDIYVAEVMATGCFTDVVIARLLETDDSEGPTYVVQFKAESKAMYNHFVAKYAPVLLQQSYDLWGDKFISFRSIMQVVN